MPIHIVNTGQPGYETRFYDAETGEDLTTRLHLYGFEISIPNVHLLTRGAKMDITVEQAQMYSLCPCCGHKEEKILHSAEDL